MILRETLVCEDDIKSKIVMTDILLLIGSIICLLVGLAGAVLPLPGPH